MALLQAAPTAQFRRPALTSAGAGEEGGAFRAGIHTGSISTTITFQMCGALQTQKVNMAGRMYQ